MKNAYKITILVIFIVFMLNSVLGAERRAETAKREQAPEKAIKFEIKEVLLPDGSLKKVKYPYVVRDLCIGCGICENKCPLPGAPGIFVNTENQKRLTKADVVLDQS